jgi:AcrR family transcriptional regulator
VTNESDTSGHQPLPHGAHGLTRSFVIHNQRERIQSAAMEAVAANGYLATTVGDICTRAHVSSKTFYEHFIDKQDAVLEAVDSALGQAMAVCLEAFGAAPGWPEAIWDAMAALLQWGAGEPAYLRTAVVELPAAGPAALERLHDTMDAFALFLDPGFELAPAGVVPRLIRETVAGGVLELIYQHAAHEPAETLPAILPHVVRYALTPFLGPEVADAHVQRRLAALDG